MSDRDNSMNKITVSRKILKQNDNLRIPLFGSFELTFRCNFKCVHCCTLGCKVGQELTTSEIINILDQLAEAGCLWLQLTGGEPLLRSDFKEIYTSAKKKGFLVTIFTNGAFISDDIIELFKQYPPYRIEVTFYSCESEVFDSITRIKGSYNKCINSIERLINARLPLVLKAVVMNINSATLKKTIEWCAQRKIIFKYDFSLIPSVDGSLGPYQWQLSEEEVISQGLFDFKKPSSSSKDSLNHSQKNKYLSFTYCGAGKDTFNISPDGKLTVCALARQRFYNLRKGTFIDGWNNFLPNILNESTPLINSGIIGTKKNCLALALIEQNARQLKQFKK